MAPTQGRVAKPEQRWGYRHSSPAVTSYLLSIVTIELSLTVFSAATCNRQWVREQGLMSSPTNTV